MARAPLLQLSGVSLGFGGAPLFSGLDLAIRPGDRLALVGRNGSGKSSLMKVMAGRIEPDAGAVVAATPEIGYLRQHPDLSSFATLGDFVLDGLGAADLYQVEAAAAGLGFDPAVAAASASGGERRRAALARALAGSPALLLLDEPTNHLDIDAITWLEDQLARSPAAAVIISHDRAFLRATTRALLWLDRGVLRRREGSIDQFEDWRDTTWAEEDLARHKLDRKIRSETRWAAEGISARRKRNMGRVRALAALRAERRDQIARQGTAALDLSSGPASGKRVIEAQGLAKAFAGRPVIRDFSLKIGRGDRIALVGPNGSGKTTLLGLLTGTITPDSGTLRLGTGLQIATFDQNRAALDPEATLWETLTGDPATRVRGRADQVMVRGTPRHVVGYLQDFLFSRDQARAPVRSLSGGEAARLLLARLMARESNLLVLDEPTNDLDAETLDLLQEVLADYPGTVLFVSHDRDFIDRLATATVVLAPGGRATVYAGGWSDALAQGAAATPPPAAAPGAPRTARPTPETAAEPPAATAAAGLSFTERHRLQELPARIARLEAEIARLSDFLSDPAVYTATPARAERAAAALAERQAALDAAESDWLTLAERAERAGTGG